MLIDYFFDVLRSIFLFPRHVSSNDETSYRVGNSHCNFLIPYITPFFQPILLVSASTSDAGMRSLVKCGCQVGDGPCRTQACATYMCARDFGQRRVIHLFPPLDVGRNPERTRTRHALVRGAKPPWQSRATKGPRSGSLDYEFQAN